MGYFSLRGTNLGNSNASTAPFKSLQHEIADLNVLTEDTAHVKRLKPWSRTWILPHCWQSVPIMCSQMQFHHIKSGLTGMCSPAGLLNHITVINAVWSETFQ